MKRRWRIGRCAALARPWMLAALGLFAAAAAAAQPLSPEDEKALAEALRELRGKERIAAQLLVERAKDPLPAKILTWIELTREPAARFADMAAFAEQNPHWPLNRRLRIRAEEAAADVPDDTLLAHFKRNPPLTARGKLRFADMLVRVGQPEAAAAAARELWTTAELDAELEAAILQRHGGSLLAEHHIARLDRLLWDGKLAPARRQLLLVPESWQALGAARLALAARETDAEKAVSSVPAELKKDPGLLYELVRWHRTKNRLREAAKVLGEAPQQPASPAVWWAERDAVARRLLEDGDGRLAYEVAAQHGFEPGGLEFAEAEFLAGWIALRRLQNPKGAYDHFTRLGAAVKAPISVARAAYWTGRAAEALKMPDVARARFAEAAEQTTTYYGQLAADRLESPSQSAEPPAEIRPEVAAAFERNELSRAARALAAVGESEAAKLFLVRLIETAGTPAEYGLIGRLAESIGHLDMAVLAAKRAEAAGLPLPELGYPVLPSIPDGPADKALVLAVARQESLFNKAAVSPAGARGLMQLMPATAEEVARGLSMPYSAARLVTDPEYNLALGQAYLSKLLGRFNRSTLLTVAAYNAGPGRINRWLNEYGDPRRKAVDAVDWVESLPYEETRNYVQRVLENLQVYRTRLGPTGSRSSLLKDLEG